MLFYLFRYLEQFGLPWHRNAVVHFVPFAVSAYSRLGYFGLVRRIFH